MNGTVDPKGTEAFCRLRHIVLRWDAQWRFAQGFES